VSASGTCLDREAHAQGAIAELKHHGADRARCGGIRLLQLKLLAAATAMSLERPLKADDAAAGGQTGDPANRTATVLALIDLLPSTIDEIGRLVAPAHSSMAPSDGRAGAAPIGRRARHARSPRALGGAEVPGVGDAQVDTHRAVAETGRQVPA
jgi:hypothetical protein